MSLLKNHIITYPTPYNLTYNWSFGFLAGIMLINQIITGIILAMYYLNDINLAFDSIEFFMRNINYGWFIRYLHSNGASVFFIIIYLHIGKGLYYKSYAYPRQKIWYSGLILFFLLMATAFLGYILPWGQMSFWGATVITSLVTGIPIVGNHIVGWLWGGYTVSAPTLMRFSILHYLLPFFIIAGIFLHLLLLHEIGSSNPLGADKKNEKIMFFPFFFIKDFFFFSFLGFLLILLVCFYPNYLNHWDNYTKANSLLTPKHIVPEWYFLPFYAILRSIENKNLGIFLMLFSLLIFFLIPFITNEQFKILFIRIYIYIIKFLNNFGIFFFFFLIKYLGKQITSNKKLKYLKLYLNFFLMFVINYYFLLHASKAIVKKQLKRIRKLERKSYFFYAFYNKLVYKYILIKELRHCYRQFKVLIIKLIIFFKYSMFGIWTFKFKNNKKKFSQFRIALRSINKIILYRYFIDTLYHANIWIFFYCFFILMSIGHRSVQKSVLEWGKDYTIFYFLSLINLCLNNFFLTLCFFSFIIYIYLLNMFCTGFFNNLIFKKLDYIPIEKQTYYRKKLILSEYSSDIILQKKLFIFNYNFNFSKNISIETIHDYNFNIFANSPL